MKTTIGGQAIIVIAMVLAALVHRTALAQTRGRTPSEITQPDEEDHSAEAADVSRQLANPIANMVSIPFQFNWFGHLTPFDSTRFQLNVQPVVPFTLNDNWNLIMRFILPYIGQPAEPVEIPGSGISDIPESGLSDITLSLFVSPAHSKLIWGVGPAFLIPTSTNPALTSGRWSIGPTAVVLREIGPWTVGLLVNQLWSYAAEANYFSRPVSQMFVQPFATYQMKHAVSLTFTSEQTYDWKAPEGQRSLVPLIAELGKVTRLGPFPFQVLGGGGYFVERPDIGPHWMARLNFILILPRQNDAVHKK